MTCDRTIKLGDLAATVFSGRAMSRLKAGSETVAVVNMRDIDTEVAPRAKLDVAADISTSGLPRLQAGDIIITARGSVRVAVARESHAGAIPGANTVVLRLRPPTPPNVIAAYLRHPRVAGILLNEFIGSTTAGFSVEGLKNLSICSINQANLEQMSQMIEIADRYYAAMIETAEARRTLAAELVMRGLRPIVENSQ